MKKILFVISLSLVLATFLFLSCSEDQPGLPANPHPADWMNSESPQFHGQIVLADGNSACAGCHGSDFQGGNAGLSCYQCHAYPHVGVTNSEPRTHRQFAASRIWNIAECTVCHGADYSGGRVGKSCIVCHAGSNGPATCGTCHAMPPIDNHGLMWGMDSTANAFGAHEFHVEERGYGCAECHASANGLAHVGPLPGDVNFVRATLAVARGFQASATHLGPVNGGNATCAVYCHSNGRGGAPNQTPPEWVAQNVEFSCTSCHTLPPASPHPQVQTCHNCHSNVDPSSTYPSDIRFIDPQLHINGLVDL